MRRDSGPAERPAKPTLASTPYAVWRELLREFLGFGRDDPDDVVVNRLGLEVATRAPDLAPWLPLIGIAFGVEVPPTPEVEMLAERNRRSKLHETVDRLLDVMMPDPVFIEIENAQHMDIASAELLSFVAGQCGRTSVARRRCAPAVRLRVRGPGRAHCGPDRTRAPHAGGCAAFHEIGDRAASAAHARAGSGRAALRWQSRSSCATCCTRPCSPAASTACRIRPSPRRWHGSTPWRPRIGRWSGARRSSG